MDELIILLLGFGLASVQLGTDNITRLFGLLLMIPGIWLIFIDRRKT